MWRIGVLDPENVDPRDEDASEVIEQLFGSVATTRDSMAALPQLATSRQAAGAATLAAGDAGE